jgi:hypothetical protein
MNRGDAGVLSLDIDIIDEPISQDFADDIEVTFNPQCGPNCVQKSLKDGTIYWDATTSKYLMFLQQADTYKMKTGANTVQCRLLKDNIVVSSGINTFFLGNVNSKEILV